MKSHPDNLPPSDEPTLEAYRAQIQKEKQAALNAALVDICYDPQMSPYDIEQFDRRDRDGSRCNL
jgi:hypothetical protein